MRMDYQEKESKVLIQVEETPEFWPQKSRSDCATKSVRGYDRAPERRWRHLKVCQFQSENVCALQRWDCQGCRKLFTVWVPCEGRSRGLTQEFEAFALTLMREIPVKKSGKILAKTDQKLWLALLCYVDAAWWDLSWENVIWVGADEMNSKKGHTDQTVFVDLQAKRVLLAVEGEDAGTREHFASELSNHNGHPKAIKRVAIDMSPTYEKEVRENCDNAQIVFDKIHVVSQGTQVVDEVRRAEVRQVAQTQEQLERTSWLWRKNPESWTAKESDRWVQLKAKPLVIGLAYSIRLEFQKAYATGTVRQVRSRSEIWCRWGRTEAEALPSGSLESMRKAIAMAKRHLEGIGGNWPQRLTAAFPDGLNSLLSATKRRARGYRSSEYQIATLYFIAGRLETPNYD